MAFKPSSEQPDFSRLQISLLNAQLQVKYPALYQTISELINKTNTARNILVRDVDEANAIIALMLVATYITENDETILLPSSRQILAGTGITLDYSVAGQLTVSTSSETTGYWTPLTDGDTTDADIIFANGECVAVFVPTP